MIWMSFFSSCQIVCFIMLVPNCPDAKLSVFIMLVPNCPGAKLSGAKLSYHRIFLRDILIFLSFIFCEHVSIKAWSCWWWWWQWWIVASHWHTKKDGPLGCSAIHKEKKSGKVLPLRLFATRSERLWAISREYIIHNMIIDKEMTS